MASVSEEPAAKKSPPKKAPKKALKKAPKKAPKKAEQAQRVVAVTGAFGSLGRRLLARLEADDDIDRVVAIDVRSGSGLDGDVGEPGDLMMRHPKLSAHNVDFTAPGAERELKDVFASEGVEGVFHLAFLSTPTHHMEMAHELETVGTHYVLNAAAATGVSRLVSLSSTMCYGARADNPAFLTESDPLRPPPSRSLRDKAEADEQVRKFASEHGEGSGGVAVAIARVGALVPTAKDHFWTRLFSRRVVPGVLGYDPLLQLMHPDDAVRALHLLWKSSSRGIYNVVGQSQLPFSHIVTRLHRVPLYLPARIGQSLAAALWSAQLIEMPQHFWGFLRWPWLCDDKKIRDALGFVPQHDITTVLNILASSKEAS